MVNYIPQRGDFIRLNFDPQAGHEQMGTRPALVVSQDKFNRKMGFVFVCPIGNTQRKNPFYIPIPDGEKELRNPVFLEKPGFWATGSDGRSKSEIGLETRFYRLCLLWPLVSDLGWARPYCQPLPS
ncbi:MAG: type II toxin-antitoxin system PemK/MazF family toxin [Hormoscilla sp.]